MGSNTAVEAKHTDSRRATRALEGAGATAHLPADRGPGTLRLPGARRRAVARPWRRVLRQGSGGCPQPWRRSYTCLKVAPYDGCGRISRWADPAEELISEMVIHELAGPGLSDALRRRVGDDSDHDGLVTDLAEDEAALAQLAADHYSARLISRAGVPRCPLGTRGQDHRHQASAGSPTTAPFSESPAVLARRARSTSRASSSGST